MFRNYEHRLKYPSALARAAAELEICDNNKVRIRAHIHINLEGKLTVLAGLVSRAYCNPVQTAI